MSTVKEYYESACYIASVISGAFISGSFLVDEEAANDIDIFCSKSAFNDDAESLLIDSGYHRETLEEAAKYNTGFKEDDYELLENWRNGAINVIVVTDKFYAAYLAASAAMREAPEMFRTREKRVALHNNMKDHIRTLFKWNAHEEFSDPCT